MKFNKKKKKIEKVINKNTKKIKTNLKNNKIKNNITKFIKDNKNIILIILSFIWGSIISFLIITLYLGKDFISIKKDLGKVIDTYYTIKDNYYGNIDNNLLIDNAINGIISTLEDGYTDYSNKKVTDDFKNHLDGNYHGIGTSIITYPNGNITILEVFDGSPSDKAGLEKNDIILKVDSIDLKDKDGNYLSNYIKNSNKKNIVFTIKRNEEEKNITIKLDDIVIPTVKSEVIDKDDMKIGYININLFGSNTYKEFKSNLEKIEKDNIQGLIIDLRNNGGGYLKAATDISSLFLKKGSTIYGLYDDKKIDNIKDKTKEHRSYPVVVLINNESASASEILAMALKDSYGAKIVGSKSFGKGTVQETKKLSDGSMIKYTAKKWLTPKGNSINQIGIIPDIYISMNEEFYIDLNKEKDNQLNEAINVLLSK